MHLIATTVLALTLGATLGAQAVRSAHGFVDPNTATEKELLALPHVTPAIAKTIVDGRPFKSMGPFNAVLSRSLKKEQLAELYDRMFNDLR